MATRKLNRPAVSTLRSHTGFWLRFVSNHVSQEFARKLLETGVTTAEWVLLREMYDGHEHTPSLLAEHLGLTRGAVSRLLDRLIAKALATRREHGEDRRFQRVALTVKGRKLVPALAALADQNDETFFKPLSAAERASLLVILEKLVKAHGLQTLPIE